MKLEVLKCPSCGANIEFEEGAESCECEYCGANVTIAPSQENKNNVTDVLKKFTPQVGKPIGMKSKKNSATEEGPIRKVIKFILNALFVMNLLFAGISVIIAITDGDTGMFFAAMFCLIYAAMFKVLALTPKGSKHILGKEKGLKPVYFVVICFLVSFMMIMLSPSTEDTTDTNASDTAITEIVSVNQ